MPVMVSRSERRVPAARIAPNDDPYSMMRRSPRCHQTRCGMWCTSGCAPVAIEVRHTGVSDGNVVTPRRYSPASARAERAGVERSPTAFSNVDGVRPSITMRMALPGKRSEAGVLLARPFAGAHSEGGQCGRLQIADEGDQREHECAGGGQGEQQRRAAGRSAASNRTADERRRAEAAEQSPDSSTDRVGPAENQAEAGAGRGGAEGRERSRTAKASEDAGEQEPERGARTCGESDQPHVVHRPLSVDPARFAGQQPGERAVEHDPALPMLVYFY